jgi:hypothetical protein
MPFDPLGVTAPAKAGQMAAFTPEIVTFLR